jgi:integrase
MVFEYKREPLEEDEILALRKACRNFEEELIINVLLETGMRVAEFSKLTEEEISWQRGCITTIGKGNKRNSNSKKNNRSIQIRRRNKKL